MFERVQLCEMADDDRPLGYYGVENGMEIHVVDEDPYSLAKNGGLEDVSLVRCVFVVFVLGCGLFCARPRVPSRLLHVFTCLTSSVGALVSRCR